MQPTFKWLRKEKNERMVKQMLQISEPWKRYTKVQKSFMLFLQLLCKFDIILNCVRIIFCENF